MKNKLSPCPCCGEDVIINVSRDINVSQYYIDCGNDKCILRGNESPYHMEVHTSQQLPLEMITFYYNQWCESNPTRWCETSWLHYKDK